MLCTTKKSSQKINIRPTTRNHFELKGERETALKPTPTADGEK
jgi:hypothetical protein